MIRKDAFRLLILPVFLFCVGILNAQPSGEQIIAEADSVAKVLFIDTTDQAKIITNQVFEEKISEFLGKAESINFTWDSIPFVKYLQPEDGSFGILTWVVPLNDHNYLYAGFLQKMKSIKSKSPEIDTVFRLKPTSSEIENSKSFSFENWPGAVYTQILPREKRTSFYTLLGWVGKPDGLAGKTIETLSFDTAGAPVFGVPVFSMKDGRLQNRVLFEYTSEVPFHLAWEQQRLPGEKRRNDWMIIFNRIGGNTPGMGRMFRGPVPSYEYFDAFAMIGGKWVFFEDVKPVVNTKGMDDKRPDEIGLTPGKDR